MKPTKAQLATLGTLAIGIVIAGMFACTFMNPGAQPIRDVWSLDQEDIPSVLSSGTTHRTGLFIKERCIAIDDTNGSKRKYCGPLKYDDMHFIQIKAAQYLSDSRNFGRLQPVLNQMAKVDEIRGQYAQGQALIARYSRNPSYELHAMLLGTHMCRSTAYIPDQYSVSKYWQSLDSEYGRPNSGVAMLWNLAAMATDRIQYTAGLRNLGAVSYVDARYPSCLDEAAEDNILKALRAQDYATVTDHFNQNAQGWTTGEILANLSLEGFMGLVVYPHEQVTDADHVLNTIKKIQEQAWANEWLIDMFEIANEEGRDIPHPAKAFDTVYVYDYSLDKPQLVLANDQTHLSQLVRQSVNAYPKNGVQHLVV
jgi:hypothetical protein